MRIALLLLSLSLHAQPLVDYHQHLFHPDDTGLARDTGTVTARELIALLDAAGIKRAVILSAAYQFANPNRPAVENEYAKVRAENDWTATQAAVYPDRLIAFCGFNPLRDYALDEMRRCAKDSRTSRGIKLHFGNSDVDLDNPEHIAKLRRVFAEANRLHMAITVHMHTSVTMKRPYGARQARVFLEQILAAAPDVPVQIAHLTGAGSFDDDTDQALGVFADAIAKHDRRVAHVWFDLSGIGQLKEYGERIAARIRQIGPERILFGSDGAVPGNSPREFWEKFRQLPLTEPEFRKIETNLAPYIK
jgi:predicted TIM-barrel fold metal-dependent hydrolase